MTRTDRLMEALESIARDTEHANHAYLICGKCIAERALKEDSRRRRREVRK